MKKITYQPKQVRIFLALLLVLLLVLTFRFTRHGSTTVRMAIMLIELAVVGMLTAVPKAFFPVFKIIMTASAYLGSFIFAVLSILIFFLILTPLALAMKLGGKKFMSHRIDPSLPTYYEEAEDRHNIERQF